MQTADFSSPHLLSGAWKLLVGESDFAFLPPPRFRLDTIHHDEPDLRVRTHQIDANGDNIVDRNLVIGAEPVEILILGRPRLVSARWDGGDLLIETRSTVSGNHRLLEDRLSLHVHPYPARTRLAISRLHHLPGGAVHQTLRFRAQPPETPAPARDYNGD